MIPINMKGTIPINMEVQGNRSMSWDERQFIVLLQPQHPAFVTGKLLRSMFDKYIAPFVPSVSLFPGAQAMSCSLAESPPVIHPHYREHIKKVRKCSNKNVRRESKKCKRGCMERFSLNGDQRRVVEDDLRRPNKCPLDSWTIRDGFRKVQELKVKVAHHMQKNVIEPWGSVFRRVIGDKCILWAYRRRLMYPENDDHDASSSSSVVQTSGSTTNPGIPVSDSTPGFDMQTSDATTNFVAQAPAVKQEETTWLFSSTSTVAEKEHTTSSIVKLGGLIISTTVGATSALSALVWCVQKVIRRYRQRSNETDRRKDGERRRCEDTENSVSEVIDEESIALQQDEESVVPNATRDMENEAEEVGVRCLCHL